MIHDDSPQIRLAELLLLCKSALVFQETSPSLARQMDKEEFPFFSCFLTKNLDVCPPTDSVKAQDDFRLKVFENLPAKRAGPVYTVEKSFNKVFHPQVPWCLL